MSIINGYKILTHDWRSPLRSNKNQLCNGIMPVTLPRVPLDLSDKECSFGWNYMEHLHEAATIVSWWPKRKSARCIVVEGDKDAIQRGAKRRASGMTLVRECSNHEIQTAMRALVAWTGEHAEAIAQEQWLWYKALQVPYHDEKAVENGLQVALEVRGLKHWHLQKYEDARGAWSARDAQGAWGAWGAWGARDA